jgi:hypothetical protein
MKKPPLGDGGLSARALGCAVESLYPEKPAEILRTMGWRAD